MDKSEAVMIDLVEVRRLLPLGRNKIHQMARDGTLPGVRKFGGRYLVSRREFLLALGALETEVRDGSTRH